MLLTITLVLMAMLVVAAVELWLFWWLGDRHDRRRRRVVTHVDDRARHTRTPQHGARVRLQPSVNPRRALARR